MWSIIIQRRKHYVKDLHKKQKRENLLYESTKTYGRIPSEEYGMLVSDLGKWDRLFPMSGSAYCKFLLEKINNGKEINGFYNFGNHLTFYKEINIKGKEIKKIESDYIVLSSNGGAYFSFALTHRNMYIKHLPHLEERYIHNE
jgi:hypothetical protein